MKIGLVVEGGGMKCAYSAGVLDLFLDDKITFDYCIGVSAGSANAMSFVAGQRERNKRFYTVHPKDPMFFGVRSFLKTGNIFNLAYIYGDLTNSDGRDPIDYEAFMENPAEYELVASCSETGMPVYFNKNDLIKDKYLHIMASSAIPALSKAVEIDGLHYYDGGITDSIPVQRALDMGCEKIVVITSKPRGYVKKPQSFRSLYALMCRKYPKAIERLDHRHEMYNKQQDLIYRLEKEGTCFVFAPSRTLDMSTYGMNVEANEKLYELGVSDYKDLKVKLYQFLGKTLD